MKTALLALLGCAALLAPALMGAAPQQKAEIKFEKKIHDFGTVREEGGAVACDFEFTNAGGANLVVIDATADCGCTRPTYPKKPVAPGQKGKISVKFNPYGRPGAFEKTITVRTNGKPSKSRVKIRGTVMPATKK